MTDLSAGDNLHSLLLNQEKSILHDQFSEQTELLLAEQLWEIAVDGASHNREEICGWLRQKSFAAHWDVKDFKVERLGDDVALATYWAKMIAPAISESNGALHSSIWKLNKAGIWQMAFHQATKLKG
jgi:hypothetical protein